MGEKQVDLFEYILSNKLTWEGLIRDIVREEGMDPWDIDVGKLAAKYSEKIKDIIDIDFRVSGKFLLTAAILLKMKSDYLLTELEKNEDENEGILLSFIFKDIEYQLRDGKQELIPRIPMMKKRRVTLQELIDALKKAMEVNERRIRRQQENKRTVRLNIKKVDLSEKIIEVYTKITMLFKKKNSEIAFKELLPSNDRFDIVWTFMPLLYLSNDGKVLLRQEELFGEIYIKNPN